MITFFAEARDLQGLHAAARARAEQLQVSRAALDAIAGLADGHAAKLLARRPAKKFGAVSLGLTLTALGLKLIVVDDPDAAATVSDRWVPKAANQDRSDASDVAEVNQVHHLLKVLRSELGRRRMACLNEKLTPEQRSDRARVAANKRWATEKALKTSG